MNFNAFIYSCFILLKFSYSTSEQCTKSTSFWDSLKYPYLNVQQNVKLQTPPIKCPHLSTNSCCNSDLLKEMSGISEIKLKGLSEEKIEFLLTMFSNDSYVLMNMFLSDLDNTKNDLNQLFSATYGYNYKVHKVFFFSWFDKLKFYMEGKLHQIGQLLDDFFLEMAEKIVKILIPPESGPEVSRCHTARLIEAKPYQDTDISLKNKIIRSYPPARLLVNAIAVGRDVFKRLMQKTTPTANCYEKFNTAFHCMLCNGFTIKSCPTTCKTVVENCFGTFKSSDLKKLDRVFNKYIKVVILLAARMDNPFNFPSVNHKMNVQISTAIMNVQNTYPNVKEQIKVKCQKVGGLQKRRRRRQASKEFYNWQNVNSNSQKPWWEKTLDENMNPDSQKKNTVASHSSKPNDFLTPIVKLIKTKYQTLEKYFHKIVPEFCSANAANLDSPQCWNGTAAIKQEISLEKNGKKKVDKNSDPIIKAAANQLHEITMRINDYLNSKNADPETLTVGEFKLHNPKPEVKPAEKNQKTSHIPLLEGSGDNEKFPLNEPILTPNKVEPKPLEPAPATIPTNQVKEPVKPNIPNKPDKNWQFPSWPDGSGDAELKKPDIEEIKTLKPKPWPVKQLEKKSSTTSTKITSTVTSAPKTVTKSTVKPNQIPDDEDINPIPEELPPKIKQPVTTTKAVQIIQPEGSGSDPDVIPRKPKIPINVQPTTTTRKPVVALIPDKSVEGSGTEIEPKPDLEKSRPMLPMLPGSVESSTEPAKTKKPWLNPDEELPPIEGSGGRSPIQSLVPSKPHTIPDSTLSPPTKAQLPEQQYPGKIPSEVWIPGIDGARGPDKESQKTTPGGRANRNHRSTIATVATLSLLLIYSLL